MAVTTFQWYGGRVIKKIQQQQVKLLNKFLKATVRDAKRNAPVDTGRLRAGIHSEEAKVEYDSVEGKIVSDAPYSSFVEYGTARMAAQPFLRPAIAKNKGKLKP